MILIISKINRGKIIMRAKALSALLIASALFVSAFQSPPEASAIVVRPSKLDHFVLQTPEEARAGEEFTVRIQAYDAYGNLITNFGEAGRDIQVSVSGMAGVRPAVIKAESFSGGVAGITVFDKKAETIVLSLYEAGGSVPLSTKEISIAPNRLDHFIVKAPDSVEAGQQFDIKITAKDAFENTVRDNALSRDIKLLSLGSAELKNIASAEFKGGVSVVRVMAEKTGPAVLEVRDMARAVSGRSGDIAITPSTLDRFNVSGPESVEAGMMFEVSITAIDRYGNIASNYSSYGSGLTIASSGAVLSSILPSEFKAGKATVSLTLEKAEDITLTVVENNRTQHGKSNQIRVTPSSPERFVVITPDDAVAGQKFRIKVEAYDRFNNLIKNYNLKGIDISLNASGSGTLKPDTASASEFVDGIAELDVIYDRAESIVISAAVISKEKALLKEERPEVKEKQTVLKDISTEKPVVEDKTLKKTTPPIKKPKKEEQKVVKKQVPQVTAKKEQPKVQKPEKTKEVFEVSDINIIEAQNKALFVISIPGLSNALNYKDGLEFSEGKDWVRLRLSPAVNRIKKPLSFKSSFIGDVKVKDGIYARELDILFELLPTKVKYDIKRSEDSIVISITPF